VPWTGSNSSYSPLQVSVVCTVFGFGLKTTPDDLSYLIRRPGLLVRSLLAVFMVMPVVAVLLSLLFDFGPTVERALIALAVSPVPPLLPQKESKACGDQTTRSG
jgi:BASS family bile acid:Na+ symporter